MCTLTLALDVHHHLVKVLDSGRAVGYSADQCVPGWHCALALSPTAA